MSLSNISCASRAGQGRTTAADAARQQGIGQTLPVISTADVLAQAAVTAAHAVGLAHSFVLENVDLQEGAGESEYFPGSSSKRKRHAVQPCKDASVRKTRSTRAGVLLSPSLQEPDYATSNSPANAGQHCSLASDRGPAESDPQTQLQALGYILHLNTQLSPISAPGLFGGMRSKTSQPVSKKSLVQPSGLDENHTHNLQPPGLASNSNGAAPSASGAHIISKPQSTAESEPLDDVEMDSALRYQGYMSSAGSNPELFVFTTRTGVHMVCLLSCLIGIGHDKISGAQALSNFRRDGDYAVGGMLAGRLCKACHMIGKGCTMVFAPVVTAVEFMESYWSKTKPAIKLRFAAGKEVFMTDLKAFIPRKRIDKEADRVNIPGTSELGSEACRAYSKDIEAPDHGDISEDISSFRMDPVPMSGLKDSPDQKKRDLNITMVNVLECLSVDFTQEAFTKFQMKVQHAVQNLSEEQVGNFMGSTHIFLRGSYYHRNHVMMRDILDDMILGIF